jgi:transcriptional regulator of arginine metabolism
VKSLRHQKIREIIENRLIQTQEELADMLRKEGIDVTQATVSRDIKELMLIKIPTGDGTYKYGFPPDQNIIFSQSRMERIFRDSVIGIDFSENLVVIRTLPGTANSIASTIDNVRWPEIVGTVAGDDTILIIVKPKEAVHDVITRFQNLIG